MTKNLRKIHSRVWLVMTALLPVGIVLAWLVIPVHQASNLITSSKTDLLPFVHVSDHRRDYCIEIRTNSDSSQWQLHWINQRPLAVPTALIYHVQPGTLAGNNSDTSRFTNAALIGRIEATGHYQFPLKNIPADGKLDLVIFDFIHEKVVDSITIIVPPVTKQL